MIAKRRPHTDAMAYFKPDFDFDVDVRLKAAAGLPWEMTRDDLYPDAIPTLLELREQGYRLQSWRINPLRSSRSCHPCQ